jgi:hypothetical protein
MTEQQQEKKEEYQKEKSMSKAATLAMELSKEKRRLAKELDELQNEFDAVSPTTPVGTLDWYIKWFAVIFGVTGIFLQNAGLVEYGLFVYLASSIAWTLVGVIWNDKAIIIGSVIPATAVALSIVKMVIGT